jgi:hypothetical protein
MVKPSHPYTRQTVVRLRWAVEVEIDYWVP